MLEILHFPDKRLRQIAKPYSNIDGQTIELANQMLKTMYAENGIGLAAVQVNVQKRLVVIDISEQRNNPQILINPEIMTSGGSQLSKEGCLSVPEHSDTVERAENINYQYLDTDGHLIELETNGLLAICIQHEIDHLNGQLFIDRLSQIKQQRLHKKFNKAKKARVQALL